MSQSPGKRRADQRAGVAAGVAAYTIWGFFPVYFKLIEAATPAEILVHRIVWAVPFGALVLYLRRQWPDVRNAFRNKATIFWLACSAICIAANWLIYVWAVHNERIIEASLGYFINPLMYVAVGVFAFSESLSRMQLTSVVLAAIGVAYMTFVGGVFPWVALTLAAVFTIYGVIRKQVSIGAMPGLFVETALVFPLAFAYLLWLLLAGQSALTAGNVSLSTMLVMAGPLTVIPLWMFAAAARKLTLTTVGFLQFICPTLQFLVGLYYGETLTAADVIAFVFIWAAIALFIADAAKKKPPQRSLRGLDTGRG